MNGEMVFCIQPMDHWMMLRASRILRDRYTIAHAPAEGRGWLRVFNAAPTAQLLFVALDSGKRGARPPLLHHHLSASASTPPFPASPLFFQIFYGVFRERKPPTPREASRFTFHARSSNGVIRTIAAREIDSPVDPLLRFNSVELI